MIRSLHHMAFRCSNSEKTRAFYEDVIGLEFAAALSIEETKTGRPVRVLHTFFTMQDGAALAFFEAPDMPFEFKQQHDFDLHVSMETDAAHQALATARAQERGLSVRGPSDHGFIRSIYLDDPDGYVVELAVKTPEHDRYMAREKAAAREVLASWSRAQQKT
jgi:catechol-2,3-dioxygenase